MFSATADQVKRDPDLVASITDYILWLADQDDQFPLTAGQIAAFYREHVEKGRWPGEVVEDLGLPSYPDWDL